MYVVSIVTREGEESSDKADREHSIHVMSGWKRQDWAVHVRLWCGCDMILDWKLHVTVLVVSTVQAAGAKVCKYILLPFLLL